MNRYRKEEIRKWREKRKGLSADAIRELDAREAWDRCLDELARKLHSERFPEEYDHICDDFADSNRRSRGENPMSLEYIDRVNQRRMASGFKPLSANGMPQDNETMAYCRERAREWLHADALRGTQAGDKAMVSHDPSWLLDALSESDLARYPWLRDELWKCRTIVQKTPFYWYFQRPESRKPTWIGISLDTTARGTVNLDIARDHTVQGVELYSELREEERRINDSLPG